MVKRVEKRDIWQAHLRIFHVESLSMNGPKAPSMRRYVSSVLLLSAIAVSILSSSMQVDASTIAEWSIPTDNSAPRGIYLDGNLLYFTEYSANKIGCLDVSSGLFKEWTIPTASSGPHDIYVSGGLVYFTEYSALGNSIGCFNPSTGVFNEWVVPTAASQPRGICVSGGLVYFTEESGNKIGCLNPFSGQFTEWGTHSSPWGITASAGMIFFTAHKGTDVGRLDPATNIITYWGDAYYPTEICVSGGLVYYVGTYNPPPNPPPWYTYRIAVLDPATNLRTIWDSPSYPSHDALLFGISVSGGMIYYTDNRRNMIGRLDPATSIFNEWAVPTADSHPHGIYVSGGKVYFSENTGNKIGCLTIDPHKSVTVIGGTFHPTESRATTITTASSPLLSTTVTAASIVTTTIGTAERTASTYSLWDTLVVSIIRTATVTEKTTLWNTITSQVPVPTTVTQLTTLTILGLEHVTHTVIVIASTTVVSGTTVFSQSATTGTVTTSMTTSTTSTTTTTTTTTLTTSTTETYVPALFSRCVIASAAYGSELAPEVQFLRTFRDQSVLSTFSGNAFMKTFNNFYYSFSPAVASTISENPLLSEIVRLLLYPLIAALHITSTVFNTLSFSSELAVTVSGIVASTLIGAAYFIPPLMIVKVVTRRRRNR